jgi:outer membrane protein TolC
VTPPAPAEQPIDLETALVLAGVDNPTIALAQEAVRASLAEQLQARALLFPSVNAGANYRLHRGNLLSSGGIIRDVHSDSLYYGAGADAKATGTPGTPGIRIYTHLADALYEPQAARQRVAGSRLDAQATRNTVLLEVATRYFALLGAEALLQEVRQSERDLGEVVRLTTNFARTGQGRQGDADRARSEALLLHAEEERVEEEGAVAAADLARLLSIDPSARLQADGAAIPLVQLIDPHEDLERLLQIALLNRPEVGAQQAAIAVNEIRLRQERVRPLVPLLSVGFSAGDFGGGSNQVKPRFGRFSDRTDFDAFAVWTLQNFGLGNLAVQRRLRAVVNEGEAELLRVRDRVRREVADAHALSATRRLEADVARRRVQTAQDGYRLDVLRSRNLEGRPIEILNSFNLLHAARRDLIRALIGFNQAQFRLFVSLGQPPP